MCHCINKMNQHFIVLVTISIILCLTQRIICFPLEFPQFTRQIRQVNSDGFQTAISAGISETDPDHDCFEAAVNGGLAASPNVGADLKFAGISSGGVRCKQG